MNTGKDLFTGNTRFTNNGPSCISCHNVHNPEIVPGGLIAKDLTMAFSRLGDPGIRGILGAPPFPAMKHAYLSKELTENEIARLTAFLKTDYIRTELKRKVIGRFTEWLNKLKDDTRESLNDTIIQEKFEEILFETGIGLVKTEDEKITIRYPFLPRIGDVIQDKENNQVHSGEGEVTSRYIAREKDKNFLRI